MQFITKGDSFKSFLSSPTCVTILKGLPQAPDGFAEAVTDLGEQINRNCEGKGALRLVPVCESGYVCLVANKYLAGQSVPVSINGAAGHALITVENSLPFRLGTDYMVPWKPSDRKMPWFILTAMATKTFYQQALLIAGQSDPFLTRPAPSASELEKMAAALGTSVEKTRQAIKPHWWSRIPERWRGMPLDEAVRFSLVDDMAKLLIDRAGIRNPYVAGDVSKTLYYDIYENWRGESVSELLALLKVELWGDLMAGRWDEPVILNLLAA